MSALAISYLAHEMPWVRSAADEERFRRILHRVLGTVAVLCLIFLFVPTPKIDRTQPQELPPRLAKLLIEREAVPPPPPPKVERKADEKKNEPSTNKPDPAKPEPPKASTVPEARRPIPGRAPGEVEGARRKAAGVGLLAMKDQLAEIRGAPVAVQLNKDIKPGPGVGSGVGVGVGAGTQPGLPDRAMITSNAAGGSGGINTAGYSRDSGGGGLAGRATTLVEGVAGGGGGGGPGGGGVRGGKGDGASTGRGGAGGSVQRGASGKASRSIEEIRIVMERNKGALYAIYNRALREDPTLHGKVVVEFKIAPAGNVVDCRILSSELKDAELERKLLARMRQLDFGAKDVDQMVVSYPVDFLPS